MRPPCGTPFLGSLTLSKQPSCRLPVPGRLGGARGVVSGKGLEGPAASRAGHRLIALMKGHRQVQSEARRPG